VGVAGVVPGTVPVGVVPAVVGAVVAGPAGVAPGVVVDAVRGGVGRSIESPGLPIKYPAMPEPSIRATTRAASVERFMRNPRKKRPDLRTKIVQTLWSLKAGPQFLQAVAGRSRCG
jgi:hypothetical protein